MPFDFNHAETSATALAAAGHLIDLALAEDLGTNGDITTQAICNQPEPVASTKVQAVIIAKSTGVLAGVEIAQRVFQKALPVIGVEILQKDGVLAAAQSPIMRLRGAAAAILTHERTALNFVQRLSGIATLTHQFVEAIAGTRTRILDTRKTTPGWRLLEKYAVRCGGGVNHRLGLHDMFLIKENHITAAGGLAAAVLKCRAYAREHAGSWRITVEVKNLSEVALGLELKVDQIMLDNMFLPEMQQAVALVAGRVPLEASGNVNLQNVRALADTGVDFISIGALTHSAPAMDFSLLLI